MANILIADLEKGECYAQGLDKTINKSAGGRLLGLELYRKYQDQNPLIFASSRFNTNPYERKFNGRVTLLGKSPLTGNVYSSNSGGPLGVSLAEKGYDALIILGSSNDEVYIDIENERISHEKPQNSNSIEAGKSAYSGSNYAILSDNNSGTYGRGGFGSAFAGKNLKGVSYSLSSQDQKPLWNSLRETLESIHLGDTRSWQPTLKMQGLLGLLIQNNWQNAENSSLYNKIQDQIKDSESDSPCSCYDKCSFRCPGKVNVDYDGIEKIVKGPHNQTAQLLGPNLGISDIQEIYNLSELCNEAGIDTMSFGAVIAAAMDMYENGFLEDTDEIEMEFGNYSSVVSCLEKIVDVDDQSTFTKRLRKGVKTFTEEYGHPESAMQVKGLSFSAYDVVNMPALALWFAVSNRGPDHFRGGGFINMEGGDFADAIYRNERSGIICDIFGLDRFSSIGWFEDEVVEFTKQQGQEIASDELDYLVRKTLVLERTLYLENSGGKVQDNLPRRILDRMDAVRVDDFKSHCNNFEQWAKESGVDNLKELFYQNVSKYYDRIGLDESGIPKIETLIELGIFDQDSAKEWYEKMKATS